MHNTANDTGVSLSLGNTESNNKSIANYLTVRNNLIIK